MIFLSLKKINELCLIVTKQLSNHKKIHYGTIGMLIYMINSKIIRKIAEKPKQSIVFNI